MKKEKNDVTNLIVEQLNLPKDLFYGMPNIMLNGNHELYLSNHRGILSYGEEELIILAKNHQIHVKGRGLTITLYTKEELQVKGYICSLGFF